jgi:nicotinamidase/pyrazinamidase
MLRQAGVRHIYIGGLATDYCVRATVLDALTEGFGAAFLDDAVKGVDVHPGDSDRALEEMLRAGARAITLTTIAGNLEEMNKEGE